LDDELVTGREWKSLV